VEYAGKGECLLNKNQMSASIQFDLIKNNYKQFKKMSAENIMMQVFNN
jgi:hypothetical protein